MRILIAAILFVASAVSAAAESGRMTISNDTGVTILRFYASSGEGSNLWGPDRLGNDDLQSGYYIDMHFDDGTGNCMWDFKAEFADGDIVESMAVNVCVESTWRYY